MSICPNPIYAAYGKSSGWVSAWTPLHLLVWQLALAFFTMLLVAASVPVQAQNRPVIEDNALIEAARAGDIETINIALLSGHNINQYGNAGKTALHVAAEWGHARALRHLLDQGARIDRRARDRQTALTYAVTRGHAEVALVLLQAGANPDRAGRNHDMPLVLAARTNQPRIVAALVKAGADVLITDNTGRTPRQWAEERQLGQVLHALDQRAQK